MLVSLLNYVPLNHVSAAVGALAHLRLPQPCAGALVRFFCRMTGADPAEAALPLSEYASIGDFFVRDLKPGARPIGAGLVSPVDGVLREAGGLQGDRIAQVKGRDYSVAELLGDRALAARMAGGSFFNLYLSPPDYHHVHVPCDGTVLSSVQIPGRLWPVNSWALNRVQDLFSVNERVVTVIQTARGVIALVMVGATNVGRISVSYDSFESNKFRLARGPVRIRHYGSDGTIAPKLNKGAKLGTFHLGSTVIMVCEPAVLEGLALPRERERRVRMGETLVAEW